MGLKATVLRRVKGELSEEPTTLIDPVTGLLTPMRECEEGKYIPVSNSGGTIISGNNAMVDKRIDMSAHPVTTVTNSQTSVEQTTSTVIAKPQPTVPQQQKPQSLKAHVLSSQAAKVANQTPVPKPAVLQPLQSPFIAKPNVPLNQNLNVNVSVASNHDQTAVSPRQSVPKPVHVLPQPVKSVTPSSMSPNQVGTICNPKQHFLQAVNKQMSPKPNTPVNPKTHLLNAVNQGIMTSGAPSTVSSTIAHVKPHMPQPTSLPSPVKQQVVVGNVAPIVKPHNLHVPQQILTGAVASPPLKHHLVQQPIVTGKFRHISTRSTFSLIMKITVHKQVYARIILNIIYKIRVLKLYCLKSR